MMESDGEYGDLSTVQDEPITHRPLFYGCLGIVTGGLGLASISVVPGPKFIIWAILLISVALIVGGSAIMIWGGWSRQTNVAIQAGFEVLPVPSSSVAVVHDELINVSIKFAPTKAQVAEANQAAIRYRTKKTRRVK